MLAAKPILYAVDSSNNPVLEAGCGVFAQPESEEALVHAINSLRNLSEEERRAMGENGRQYVMQNHDYTKLAADFTGLMEKLLHSQTDERGER